MFIFDQKAPPEWVQGTRYSFVPYLYGPYSKALQSDLEKLSHRGYIRTSQHEDQSWGFYSLTTKGLDVAGQISLEVTSDLVRYLASLYRYIMSLSFRQLLQVVYREFPEYAQKSVFQY
jgi:uncharacterized protein YwgA